MALEEKVKGNQPGKTFNAPGWDNIIKSFNEKTGLDYDILHFKNLYDKLRSSWKARKSLIKNTGLCYDPDPKTCTLDDDQRNEMIKVTYVSFLCVNVPIF